MESRGQRQCTPYWSGGGCHRAAKSGGLSTPHGQTVQFLPTRGISPHCYSDIKCIVVFPRIKRLQPSFKSFCTASISCVFHLQNLDGTEKEGVCTERVNPDVSRNISGKVKERMNRDPDFPFAIYVEPSRHQAI